jgi:ABC-type cobalt transport system substrate-binding protein
VSIQRIIFVTTVLGLVFVPVLSLSQGTGGQPEQSPEQVISSLWQGFWQAKWAQELNTRLRGQISWLEGQFRARMGLFQAEAEKEIIEMVTDIKRQMPWFQEIFEKIKNFVQEISTEFKK